MSDYLQLTSLRKLLKGEKVERDAATLPQSTTGDLFNVVGGRVAITQIIGEVTDDIQDQANATKLVATPTGGSASDICDVLDIDDDDEGTMYGITGDPTDNMVDDEGVMPGQEVPVIVKAGAVQLECAASNTGEVKWTVFYVPIDDGAYIAAAD